MDKNGRTKNTALFFFMANTMLAPVTRSNAMKKSKLSPPVM
jgi:hypothetical protein